MPLPPKGSEISYEDIQDEFGGTDPINLEEYRGLNSWIPLTGELSTEHFGGLSGTNDINITVGLSDSANFGYNFPSTLGITSTRDIKGVTSNLEDLTYDSFKFKLTLNDADSIDYFWKVIVDGGTAGTDTYYAADATTYYKGTWTWDLYDGGGNDLVPPGVWELEVNTDGTQRMSHPLGDYSDSNLPGTISNFSATTLSTTSIKLDWDASSNTTRYNIQRSSDGATWAPLTTTSNLTYTDYGLTSNYTYSYRIYPENALGWGAVSSTASATTDKVDEVINPPTPDADWLYHLTAEEFNVGDSGYGSGSHQWSWTRESKVSDTYAIEGTKSWRCIRSPSTGYPDQGWSEWGLVKDFDNPIRKGGTAHVQWSAYFPPGFAFDQAEPVLKFLRFSTVSSSDVPDGYHDILIRQGNTSMVCEYEGGNVSGTYPTTGHLIGSETIDLGTWNTFEWEVVFDTKAADAGGQGRVRVWRVKNGAMTLVHSASDYATMHLDDGKITKIDILGGTWNNTKDGVAYPLTTQYAWIDNVIIETDMSKLTQTDAQGNKVIGLGSNAPAIPDVNYGTEKAFDTFESGDLSYTNNGFSWTGSLFPNDHVVEVRTENPKDGSRSLMLQYNVDTGGDVGANANVLFDLDGEYPEAAIEYDLYIPSNIDFLEGYSQSLFSIWAYADDYSGVGISLYRQDSNDTGVAYITTNISGNSASDWDNPAYNFITASDKGTWIRIGFDMVMPTVTTPGRYVLYKNGIKVIESSFNSFEVTGALGYKLGFIGGHITPSVTEVTKFYVDNFKVYTGAKALPPVTINDLTASTQSSSAIYLNWTAVAGASDYSLEHSTNGSTWDAPIPTGGASSYTHTGLSASSLHYYRVSYVNNAGTSGPSNVVNATTFVIVSEGATDLDRIRWGGSKSDFSGESDGTVLGLNSNPYGMWRVSYYGYITSEKTLGGKKSMREDIGPADKLSDGTSAYPVGFGKSFYDHGWEEEGAEVWFRVWVYHKAGYTWEVAAETRKFMRISTKRENDTYGFGAADTNILTMNARFGDKGSLAMSRENALGNSGTDWTDGWYNSRRNEAPFVTEKWQCIEMYTKSSRSYSNGSMKLWIDGELWMEDNSCRTIPDIDGASFRMSDCQFISNWNQGLTKDVTHWWTSPAIAVRCTARDDTPYMDSINGFPYIGLAI